MLVLQPQTLIRYNQSSRVIFMQYYVVCSTISGSPVHCSILSEIYQYEFTKPTGVIIVHCLCIAKCLQNRNKEILK